MYHATGPAVPAAARGARRGARRARTAGRSCCSTPASRPMPAIARTRSIAATTARRISMRASARRRRTRSPPAPIATISTTSVPACAPRRSATSCTRTSRRASTRRACTRWRPSLGLDDLERLPAQPCLASRVETGIAIAPDDLAFIDAVETRLAARLGARSGAALPRDPQGHRDRALVRARRGGRSRSPATIGAEACAPAGRVFAGVRPYARGAAFLRMAVDG